MCCLPFRQLPGTNAATKLEAGLAKLLESGAADFSSPNQGEEPVRNISHVKTLLQPWTEPKRRILPLRLAGTTDTVASPISAF